MYTQTEQKLMDAMASMDIIDTHEHLPLESERLARPQDLFTLFSHYTRHDLFSAGMDHDGRGLEPFGVEKPVYGSLFNQDVPLEQRWKIFSPYWESIRYGSYARAALLTAKIVYGITDINEKTYAELSERITAENRPGIYQRMLCERCNIKAALTQKALKGCELPLIPVARICDWLDFCNREYLDKFASRFELEITGIDDCYVWLERYFKEILDNGAVGIKINSKDFGMPSEQDADKALRHLLQTGYAEEGNTDIADYLTHRAIEMAAERNLVVAVHAGVWGDYREIDCKHMLKLAPAHPNAMFDLYHLGMPSVRDAIMIGKNLPNVYLNLCWTHIVSQAQTCRGIDELIDQVPINKIMAFGGDYENPVEKVVGHLYMARENYAHVFGARIERGMLDDEAAAMILKKWFFDNPLALYSRLEIG